MWNFFRNKYVIAMILGTFIILISMSMFDIERARVSFVENVTGAVFVPVQKFFTKISNGISGVGNYFADVQKLRKKNEQLLIRIEDLNKNIRELDGFRSENDRFRRMLNLKENLQDFEIESAEIVAKNPLNWHNTYTIDKGSSSGLAKKQPVISVENSLVGYISDIGTNWAKVRTILDPDCAVGGIVVRSRDIGIIEGDIALRYDGLCKMTYISKNTNIIGADYIETSGMGGIFPKGILIGQVMEVRPEMHSISQYAVISPAVNFEKLTEVFVIINPPEEY